MKNKNINIGIFILGVVMTIFVIIKTKFQKTIIDTGFVWNPYDTEED